MESLNGGILITLGTSVALPDEIKAQLLEKWDMANEDGEVNDLIAEAKAIAAPKAYVVPATIDALEDDHVILSGIRFESTLMPQQLRPLYEKESNPTVYAYTMTCGQELHRWFLSQTDFLLRGVAEDITIRYLGLAGTALRDYISNVCLSGRHFSSMNPGSLPTWNINGQAPLFCLLGQGAERCGVELTESMLMVPFKSGSGVYYESEHTFESCMFCDKLTCPNRRAAFVGT